LAGVVRAILIHMLVVDVVDDVDDVVVDTGFYFDFLDYDYYYS
jgi:hypothetical protein